MDTDKREAILDAATRTFNRYGFRKASIDEIARSAGVAKGTVYLACDSKEDLFYQAVHREIRAYVAECAKELDPRIAADVLMERYVRCSLALLAGRPLVRDLLLGRLHDFLPSWQGRMDEL